jgi:thioredoxin 1
MASEAVIEFTDDNFEAEVEQADVPVLVDFWAEWCMPCRMLTPVIEELAGEMEGKARIGKLDTDANRNVAAKYGVQAIPTVMLFHGGEVVHKFVGVNPKQDYVDAIEQAVAG